MGCSHRQSVLLVLLSRVPQTYHEAEPISLGLHRFRVDADGVLDLLGIHPTVGVVEFEAEKSRFGEQLSFVQHWFSAHAGMATQFLQLMLHCFLGVVNQGEKGANVTILNEQKHQG